jgi:hypothetical protein
MEGKKRIFLLLPLLILFTISCTCGAPGLKDFLPEIGASTPESVAATKAPQTKDPQIQSDNTSTLQETAVVPENTELIFLNTTRFVSNGWEYVVGEVKNTSGKTLDSVDLSMILYDANNQIVATESVSPLLSPLYPDDISPFIVSSDSWGEFDHTEFVINDIYEAENAAPMDLEIVYHTSYSDDYSLTILGEIQNNSDQPAQWVYAAGSISDANGQILNATTAYTLQDTIAPGAKAPFKLYFSDNWKDSTDYFLQLRGSPGELVEPTVKLVDYVVTKDGTSCTYTGSVENLTAEEIGFASVIVSTYDANDQLVDANWTFSDGSAIPANGKDTFTLSVFDCKEYDHEVVTVE